MDGRLLKLVKTVDRTLFDYRLSGLYRVARSNMYVRSSYFLKRIPLLWITSIDVEPIARCNLKCPFCQVPDWRRGEETEPMTPKLFSRIIGQFPRLKHVKLQGMGEPFLSPHIVDLIRLATARGLKTTILSNGTLLDSGLAADVVRAGLTNLYISFDGATKATYESLRVGADYDQVLDNICKMIRLRDRYGAATRVGMRCLVSNQAVLDELPAQVRLAASLDIGELAVASQCKIWEVCDGQSIPVRCTPFHDYRDSSSLLDRARNVAKEYGVCLNEGHYHPHDKVYPCAGPWRTMFVSVEGKVVPCSHIASPDVWCLGSLAENSARSVWNSGQYKELRRSVLRNEPAQYCASCYGKCTK